MKLELVTAPAAEPVTLTEAKLHCRVDGNDEDTAISLLISDARTWAERFTRRALMPQTWRGWLDRFPDGTGALKYSMEIPLAPVTAIASIKYTDVAGVLTTITGTDYQLDAKAQGKFPRVLPAYGISWPYAREDVNAVVVEFTAGYADAAAVPAPIKQAMLLHLGWHYEHREMEPFGMGGDGVWGQMERALERKLADWRIFTFV